MKNLIIPAAGSSTRFPNVRPKWLLTQPTGELMLTSAISGLNLKEFDSIYLVVLKNHIDKYDCIRGIKESFDSLNILHKLNITILANETRSQAETVSAAIRQENISGGIFIKDSDNYFETDVVSGNKICVYDLNETKLINPTNKSYVLINDVNLITNIIEKKIISSFFCCGGYSFESAEKFLEYYEKLKNFDNLYISHIIYSMILDGHCFFPALSNNYKDWGTIDDWYQYKDKFTTFFIDIDGVLVENSAEFFSPYWGDTSGITENIEIINKLFDSGKSQIILTTSRKQKYKEVTEQQLAKNGVKYHQIIFDLLSSKRIIINDYSNTNKFKSCDSINIKRNSKELGDILKKYL